MVKCLGEAETWGVSNEITNTVLGEGHKTATTMSRVTAIYHIIINTHRRENTLPLKSCDLLYRYIGKVIINTGSTAYAINGIENHIHILVDLNPMVTLSGLVRDIKVASNQWMKKNVAFFPAFRGWGKEYAAFSYAQRDRDMVMNYIQRQREHHQKETFEDEFRKCIERVGLEWNDFLLT